MVNLTETASAEQSDELKQKVIETWHIDAVVKLFAGGFAWKRFDQARWTPGNRLYQMNVRTAIVSTKAALRIF